MDGDTPRHGDTPRSGDTPRHGGDTPRHGGDTPRSADGRLRAGDGNVRSDSYWIAHARGRCGRCRAPIELIGLALPPQHQSLMLDCGPGRDAHVGYVWESAPCSAFLFYVEHLPDSVRRRLEASSPQYRFAFSDVTLGCYWANHCASCEALLDDHDLFCEPDGAFLPTSPSSASAIRLVRVEEAFEAAAVGYACEPQFIESMVEG